MFLFIWILAVASSRKLVYFVEIARHGARSPSDYQDWDFGRWLDGESVLSGDGMRQHYLIGQHLRRRYVESGFLPEEFNQASIDLVANEVERTQRSLISQLIGLYPSKTWKKKTSNPSVPIKLTNNTLVDENFYIPGFYMKVNPGNTMLRAKDGCPEYKKFTKKRKASEKLQEIFKKYDDIILKVAKKYSLSYEDAQEKTLDVIASVRSNSFAGFKWDSDFDEAFCDRAQELYMEYKRFVSFSPDFVARFTASDLFNGLAEILERVQKGENTEKATIFLAHDTTLFSIFSGLGLWLKEQPPFATILLIEVFLDEATGEMTVRWVYNMENIKVPGFSEEFVELNKFLHFLDDRSFDDSERACKEIENVKFESAKVKSFIIEEPKSVMISTTLALSQFAVVVALLIAYFKR